ncbi:MAG: hypothetical protein IJ086_10525 [Clostridium sp.]|nr:hypothetical protein [Clostridium sp.]
MDKNTVGIIVKNNYDDILYHENNFFIEIEIGKKEDLRFTLEEKLSEILDKKAFRIDKISKKTPKLCLQNECNDNESIVMYLVNVYMYDDNSKFLSKEDILEDISIPLLKDYYIKYIIRYNKYCYLVELYMSMFIHILGGIAILSIPYEIRTKFIFDTLFYNFWTALIIYIVLPIFILNKFITPPIVNYLVKYDISKKTINISKCLHIISIIVFYIFLFISNI